MWEEEFQNSNPEETPSSELAENVRTAKDWKDKILRAQVECESVPELQELRTRAGIARTGFLNYITSAYKELRTLESRPSSAQSGRHNISAVSGSTVSKTKIERVERYADQTVSDMQTMIDQLDQLTLESPETQLEFRQLQDRMKTTSKEVETTKRNAKELINQAIDCDLGAESTRMEAVYRELEKKEINLLRSVQELKDEYGILGVMISSFQRSPVNKLITSHLKKIGRPALPLRAPPRRSSSAS